MVFFCYTAHNWEAREATEVVSLRTGCHSCLQAWSPIRRPQTLETRLCSTRSCCGVLSNSLVKIRALILMKSHKRNTSLVRASAMRYTRILGKRLHELEERHEAGAYYSESFHHRTSKTGLQWWFCHSNHRIMSCWVKFSHTTLITDVLND